MHREKEMAHKPIIGSYETPLIAEKATCNNGKYTLVVVFIPYYGTRYLSMVHRPRIARLFTTTSGIPYEPLIGP